MADRVIPCDKCAEVTRYLEAGGIWVVTSCTPINYKPGYCRLIYKKR